MPATCIWTASFSDPVHATNAEKLITKYTLHDATPTTVLHNNIPHTSSYSSFSSAPNTVLPIL